MRISLIVDNETADRLWEAFCKAFARKGHRFPNDTAPEAASAKTSRRCLCVAPDVGRQIKLQGVRDGLIFSVTKEEFARRRPLLGPRDALLFTDVAPARLQTAVRLATAGMTLFPPHLAPVGEMAGPVLEGFEQLSETDRAIMAELSLGSRNQRIAERLGRSPKRVRHSVDRILHTLGCRNKTQVAMLAYGRFSPFLDLWQLEPKTAWARWHQM